MFRFENLEIWHFSVDFADLICKHLKGFPKEEIYSLNQQMRRAAYSVSLNIAEGSARKSKKDFSRFLDISKGSLFEIVAGFSIALKSDYITQEVHDHVYKLAQTLAKKISAFQSTLQPDHKLSSAKRGLSAISNFQRGEPL